MVNNVISQMTFIDVVVWSSYFKLQVSPLPKNDKHRLAVLDVAWEILQATCAHEKIDKVKPTRQRYLTLSVKLHHDKAEEAQHQFATERFQFLLRVYETHFLE